MVGNGKSSISSLKFLNYIVNKVNYQTNNVEFKPEGWKLDFNIKNTTKINPKKDKMNIILNLNIFNGVEGAPFYMEIEITGYFELVGEDDISKFEANAIAIMYPYLRALVSTYTSASNVAPIIMPAINVNALLKNKENK